MLRRMVLASCVWVSACSTPTGPAHLAQSYVNALKENPAAAYAQLSPKQRARLSYEQFLARHRPQNPTSKVPESWLSEDGMLRVRSKDGQWQIEDLALDFDPQQTLRAFVTFVEKADFVSAQQLLSQTWRAYYSPDKFAQDFSAEPLAPQRLGRLRTALSGPVSYDAHGAWIPLVPGTPLAVRFVLETEGYRVEAVE